MGGGHVHLDERKRLSRERAAVLPTARRRSLTVHSLGRIPSARGHYVRQGLRRSRQFTPSRRALICYSVSLLRCFELRCVLRHFPEDLEPRWPPVHHEMSIAFRWTGYVYVRCVLC